MKSCYLAAGVIAVTLAAFGSAFAAPDAKAVVTKFKTTSSVVNLQAEVGALTYSLTAQNFDDMDGVQQGIVSVSKSGFDPVTGSFFTGGVTCQGSAFANTVTVNRTSGASSVNVLLDPAAPGCTGFNSAAVTIAVTGVPVGNFHKSESGSSTIRYGGGAVDKTTFESEYFDETFSGSIGYITGAFSGNVQKAKVLSRTRVAQP
jgi:hypothetical protein